MGDVLFQIQFCCHVYALGFPRWTLGPLFLPGKWLTKLVNKHYKHHWAWSVSKKKLIKYGRGCKMFSSKIFHSKALPINNCQSDKKKFFKLSLNDDFSTSEDMPNATSDLFLSHTHQGSHCTFCVCVRVKKGIFEISLLCPYTRHTITLLGPQLDLSGYTEHHYKTNTGMSRSGWYSQSPLFKDGG